MIVPGGRGLLFELGELGRVPDLKVLAHAHERDILVDARQGSQIGGDEQAAGLVDRLIDGAAEHDALQKARRISQGNQRTALFLPARTRINQQTAVGVTGDGHFKRARQSEGLAMTTRHRHTALRIERK